MRKICSAHVSKLSLIIGNESIVKKHIDARLIIYVYSTRIVIKITYVMLSKLKNFIKLNFIKFD